MSDIYELYQRIIPCVSPCSSVQELELVEEPENNIMSTIIPEPCKSGLLQITGEFKVIKIDRHGKTAYKGCATQNIFNSKFVLSSNCVLNNYNILRRIVITRVTVISD